LQRGLDQERVAGGLRRRRAARVHHPPRPRGRVPGGDRRAPGTPGGRRGPQRPPGRGRGVTVARTWRGVIQEYRNRLPVGSATPVVTLGEGGTTPRRPEALAVRTGGGVFLQFR